LKRTERAERLLTFAEISVAKNNAAIELITAELRASAGGQAKILAAINCDYTRGTQVRRIGCFHSARSVRRRGDEGQRKQNKRYGKDE
jgi:hypothetical protein